MKYFQYIIVSVIMPILFTSCSVEIDPDGALKKLVESNEVDFGGSNGDMSWHVLKNGTIECAGTGQACISNTEFITCEDGNVVMYNDNCQNCEYNQCM